MVAKVSNKYSYLRKYIGPHDYPVEIWRENTFMPVVEDEIEACEEKIGCRFPEALREFWLEIGCGHLTTPENPPEDYDCDYANSILSPEEIASIILGEEDAPMLPDYREDFVHEGDIPFFEVADSSDYLFMKRDSEVPDRIYGASGYVLEDHFEDFIRKLYYESPTYYTDVREEKLEDLVRREKLGIKDDELE